MTVLPGSMKTKHNYSEQFYQVKNMDIAHRLRPLKGIVKDKPLGYQEVLNSGDDNYCHFEFRQEQQIFCL
jgi:hypothetical protein